MKRLIEIADLEEATVCFQQQRSYKAELKTLSDYNRSLDLYKTLVKDIKSKTLKYCEDINSIFVFKKHKTKKRSVIDYFTIMLENLMEHFADQATKVVQIVERAYVEAKDIHKKTDKYLADSEKTMAEQISYHEKVFKDYMLNVYPETDSIFFRLQGADKTFAKRENPLKEAALVQQFKAYERVLNHQIDSINESIRQMGGRLRERTQEIKVGFVKLFEGCLPQFQGEFHEQEIEDFRDHVQTRRKEDKTPGKNKQNIYP